MLRTLAGTVARLLRALAALAALVALAAGVPGLLTVFAGWPLSWLGWPHPGAVPGLGQLATALANPWSDQMIVGLIATLGWLLWAVFIRDVIAETLHAAGTVPWRSRTRPRPVPRGPIRWVAAVLVGAILSALVIHGARVAPATGTTPVASAADATARRPAVALVATPASARLAVNADTEPARSPASAAPAHGVQDRPGSAVPDWAQDAPGGVHHVVAGDNLWDIADHKLGDPYRWREIYILNRHKPQPDGYHLSDPDQIHIGWVLAMPASNPTQKPSSGDHAAQATPPAVAPPAGSPATTAVPSPTPAPTSIADPSPTRPSQAPAADAPAMTTPASRGPGSDEAGHGHGVRLPTQSWISLGLAATIAAAAALLRLQRRRTARLQFPIPVHTEPQPAPVPPSLSTVDTAGSRQLDLHTDRSMLPGLMPAPPAVLAPIGLDADGQDVSLFDLPGPGLALTGPGAEAAARGILAAVLSTGVVQHQHARPQVVTTVDTLRLLLPADHQPVGLDPDGVSFDGERLLVLPDAAAAVTHAEQEMIHRRRLLDTMHANSMRELNARDDHAEHQPPLVLLIEPDDRHAARLHAAAAHRHTLDLHPVLLGHSPDLPTANVDADGHLAPAPDRQPGLDGLVKVATLAASELAHVLDLLAQVAPRPEAGTDPTDTPVIAETDPLAAVEVPRPAGQAPPLVHLAVLGPVAATTTDGPIGAGMRSGSYGVLALLAAHPHGRTLDQLAAGLYPDSAPGTAAKRLRADITTTRRVLRQATGQPNAKFILYDPGTGLYRIDPDTVNVDLWRMLAAINKANQTADDDEACLRALLDAADCYGGEFATGLDRAWATDYATTFRHHILNVYARIAEIEETDHPDHALAALETAIEHDPINEELYQRLMRIQGRLGRADAVRRTLQLLEDRLADLGGAEVSEATRRIAARQLHTVTTSRARE